MKSVRSRMIAVFIAAFFMYFYFIPQYLLASIYAWYPDLSQDLVMMIFNLPSMIATFTCLVMSVVLAKVKSKKWVLFAGMFMYAVNGCLMIFSGGKWFSLALIAACFGGVANGIIQTATSSMLVEMYQDNKYEATRAISLNSGIATGGNMILSYFSGALCADGYWIRAYGMVLAVIPAMIVYLFFYRTPRNEETVSVKAEETVSVTKPMTSQDIFRFLLVMIPFVIFHIGIKPWNLNYSYYIVTEKALGDPAAASLVGTFQCAAGLLTGIFVTKLITKYLKDHTIVVGMAIYAAAIACLGFGTSSLPLIYFGAFISMLFYPSAYGMFLAIAGKTLPNSSLSVSLLIACLGLCNFGGAYVVNSLGAVFSSSYYARFWAGVGLIVVAMVIMLIVVPISRKWDTSDGEIGAEASEGNIS